MDEIQHGVTLFTTRKLPAMTGYLNLTLAPYFLRYDQTTFEKQRLRSFWEIVSEFGLTLFWKRGSVFQLRGEKIQHRKLKVCVKHSFVSQFDLRRFFLITTLPSLHYGGCLSKILQTFLGELLKDASVGVDNVRGATCQSDRCYVMNRMSTSTGVSTGAFHRWMFVGVVGLQREKESSFFDTLDRYDTPLCLFKEWLSQLRFCLFDVFGLLNCFSYRQKNISSASTQSILKLAVLHTFKWYNGVRVGEATNPGPVNPRHALTSIDCAFVNPTSLNEKLPCIKSLNKQLLLFAETSATKMIQMQESFAARAEGYSTLFSPPVLPQRNGLDEDTLRGQATGTAAYSKIPCRLSRTLGQSEWFPSGRILQFFLELGTLEIQVLVVYGIQQNQLKARARTDLLMQHAISLAGLTNHPTIFAGDFNHPLDSLGSCDSLWTQGFRSAASIYSERHGEPFPPTYKNQSSNGAAIFSPELVHLISDIHVNNQELFAGHHPICFRIDIPSLPLTKQKWHLPHSWIVLEPSPDFVDEAYIPMRSEDGTRDLNIRSDPQSVLYAWSSKVEASVHQALQRQHALDPLNFPYAGLPKKFKGRCKPRKIVQAPLPKATKSAWQGHYTPASDCGQIVLKQKTKQIRRLQSLKHRVVSHRPDQIHQLGEEWKAIVNSSGFPGGFMSWIQTFELGFHIDPTELPTTDKLFAMEQLLIHETDRQVAEIHRIRRAKVATQDHFDLRQQHKKSSFRKIREPSPGILQQVEVTKKMPLFT